MNELKKMWKKGSKVLFIIIIVLFGTSILLFAYHEQNKDTTLNEYYVETSANGTPFTKNVERSTPNNVRGSDALSHQWSSISYDADQTIDGGYFETGMFPDRFSELGGLSVPEPYVGNPVLDEWTLEWDLGMTRDVTSVRFQIGDLYTSYGLAYGFKTYQYDLAIRQPNSEGDEEWNTIRQNIQNENRNYRGWIDELYSSSDAGNIEDGRDTIYDPRQTDFLVANGNDESVIVYQDDGTLRYKITNVDGEWNGGLITDVARIPGHRFRIANTWVTDYNGGYIISESTDGKCWQADYGVQNLRWYDFLTDYGGNPSQNFLQIDQITTMCTESDWILEEDDIFHIYLKEGNNLYHWERTVGSGGIGGQINKGNEKKNISISGMGSIQAADGYVYVEYGNGIQIYDANLNYIETISLGWSTITDLDCLYPDNILVLDGNNDRVYNFDYTEDPKLIGYVNIYHNGASPKTISGITPSPFGYGAPTLFITSTSSNTNAELMRGNTNILYNDRYFNWEEHSIQGEISGFKITIHDIQFQNNPLASFQVKKYDSNLPEISWNKPCVTEAQYNWVYDSEEDGMDVELIQPVDDQNFVSYGINGKYDVEVDVKYPYTDADSFSNVLDLDTLTANVDEEGESDIQFSYKQFQSVWTDGGGIGDTNVISPIDCPASQIYDFEPSYFEGYGEDGDIWDLYVDDVKKFRFDESSTDLDFSIWLDRGNHIFRFVHQEGEAVSIPEWKATATVWKASGIGIEEGYHNITVFGNDTFGWEDTAYADFQVVTYPEIEITSPGQDIGYNDDIDFNFTANDNNLDGARWSLNGELKEHIDHTGLGYTLEYDTVITTEEMIANEYNQIELIVNDTDGHQSFGYRTFFLDFQAPRISFPGMVNNSFLPSNDQFSINVTDETLTTAYYYINDNPVTFELEEGLNELTIPSYEFDEGLNNLTVFAEDVVGNTATAYLNLSRDESPPVINFTSPLTMEKFFEDGSPDPIELNATVYDFFINRSDDSLIDVKQEEMDDNTRLHYNSHQYFSQGLIPTVPCITEFGIMARGNGRLKIGVYEDPLLLEDPVSVGYVDVLDEFNFNWYQVDMSNTKIDADQKYYIKVETLTPFNDIYIGLGNDPYPDGRIKMGAISRPQWDLAFRWYHKPIVNRNGTVSVSVGVNGQLIQGIENNTIYFPNLKDNFTFTHGYQTISIIANDTAGNVDEESISIQYIDTSVTTPIDVQLQDYLESEWVYKNITVNWFSNIPDYSDRFTRETYTYDVFLKDTNENEYVMAEDIEDVNSYEINTTLVSDGYYYIVVNGTDGTTVDESQSSLIRVLNGNPVITIEEPEDGIYAKKDTEFVVSVICADIDTNTYSIDQGINFELGEPADYDFFNGYTFIFQINESQAGQGVHTVSTKVMDSDGESATDSVSIKIDRETTIELSEIGTQSSKGAIYIDYTVPYDATNATIVIRNATSTVMIIKLNRSDLTGLYIIEEGLPVDDYILTMTVQDRAGNVASDIESFGVRQSAYGDFMDSILGFISMILTIIASILSALGLMIVYKGKKFDRQALCDAYGGDYCDF